MGTALTPEQASLLGRYAGKVLLLYDSDAAGLKATFRSADALLRAGVHPLVVTLPSGEDPDSVVRKGGAEALRPWLADAMDVMERKIAMLQERGFFEDIDGVRRSLDRLLPTIRATVDPTLRDIYIARVAERTGVRRETLEEETAEPEQVTWSPRKPQPAAPKPRVAVSGEQHSAERLLVLLLLRDPARIAVAAERMSETDFHDPRYRAIFRELATGRRTEDLADVLGPAAAIAAEELRRDPIEIADADRSFEAAVADMRVPGLFLQVQYVNDRLERAADEQQTELMRKKIDLQAELQKLGVDTGLSVWKKSIRHRGWSGSPTRRQNPPNNES
jgi:DNA primase